MPQPQREITTRNNPPHSSYKHISIIFMFLAILLILGVTYLVLSKVTITLYPSNEKITHEFDLLIYQDTPPANNNYPAIQGKIISTTKKINQNFSVNNGTTVDAVATGEVTLYNNRETAQTLVATTRLLSPHNILFRLKKKVIIPANSTITTEIYADKKGASGNIEPTTFTIPGLNKSLQKLVYAKLNTPITNGTKQIGILTQDDIDQALDKFSKDNSANLLAQYLNDTDDMTLIDTKIELSDVITPTDDIGTKVDTFTLKGQITVNAIFANKNNILEAAKTEINHSHDIKNSINIDPSSLTYKLKNIDTDNKTAIVTVSLSGLATLDSQTNIFDKNLLVGFTKEDLELYFSQFDSINNIDVKFYPFWVRKVPILKDHIKIQLAK